MILSLRDVSLKRDGTWILQKVDWDVKKGEHWVLFGLNGSGKTAILKMLHAEYFPTAGNVTVLHKEFGKSYLGEELRSKIGFVSSSLQEKLYNSDSAFEIVLSGAFASIGLYKKPTKEIREKAIGLLKDFDCLEYADRQYETLSQGEKQRILIARALMADPSILIFDEPTTGLDFIAREQFLETIEQITYKPNAPTMIYVTHHVEEILPVFNKALLLKKGQVFDIGNTEDMISSQKLSSFLGLPVQVQWENGRPMLNKVVLQK
ncbi:ABC transporter ATP-binding protein [Niallia sp. Krafla_26]|uniref:ABC transporter ATP-binding protein n=1 Tax=Niallia sp. Krafla_26 TaxID=3064703 RepID=UPI003D17169A